MNALIATSFFFSFQFCFLASCSSSHILFSLLLDISFLIVYHSIPLGTISLLTALTNLCNNMHLAGYIYTLGGTAVNWISKLQKIVLLSTTEAEYVVVTDANKEMMWCSLSWKNWVTSMSEVCYIVVVRVFDKECCYHARTKHIQVRYHFIISTLEDGVLIR